MLNSPIPIYILPTLLLLFLIGPFGCSLVVGRLIGSRSLFFFVFILLRIFPIINVLVSVCHSLAFLISRLPFYVVAISTYFQRTTFRTGTFFKRISPTIPMFPMLKNENNENTNSDSSTTEAENKQENVGYDSLNQNDAIPGGGQTPTSKNTSSNSNGGTGGETSTNMENQELDVNAGGQPNPLSHNDGGGSDSDVEQLDTAFDLNNNNHQPGGNVGPDTYGGWFGRALDSIVNRSHNTLVWLHETLSHFLHSHPWLSIVVVLVSGGVAVVVLKRNQIVAAILLFSQIQYSRVYEFIVSEQVRVANETIRRVLEENPSVKNALDLSLEWRVAKEQARNSWIPGKVFYCLFINRLFKQKRK